jgi:hypothetical protein
MTAPPWVARLGGATTKLGVWALALAFLIAVNYLPLGWRLAREHYQLYSLCMTTRPAADTVLQWVRQSKGCIRLARQAAQLK